MRRLAVTLTSVSLAATIAVGGCSGATIADSTPDAESTGTPSTVETSVEPAPTLMELADACPKIQDALDEVFGAGQEADSVNLRQFGELIAELVPQIDRKVQNLLESLAEVSMTAASEMQGGDALDAIDARKPWFNEMERVTDVCQELGAPLR